MIVTAEQPKKVLVVENEPALLQTLGEELTDSGFLVVTAANGQEGLACAQHERPDLIILDLLMPKMSGQEMMRELNKEAWSLQTPVLVLTNVGIADKQVQEVIANRPVWYLEKSDVKLAEVVAKARALLGLPEKTS